MTLKTIDSAPGKAKRVWVLLAITLLSVLLLLRVVELFKPPTSEGKIGVLVPEYDVGVDDNAQPSLASLINTPSGPGNASRPASVEPIVNRNREFSGVPEESLTPEQKARRLLLAKQQAEFAERASQARVKQLQQALLPANDELESLVRVEVGYLVERWREAWSNGDVDRYLSSYSSEFTPADKQPLEAWKSNRRSRIYPQRNIRVDLSEFKVSMLEELNSGVVEFNQRYQSGDFIENSRKRLSLAKQDGEWKITSEVELN